MLLQDELQAYFKSGRIRSEVHVAEILSQLEDFRTEPHSKERDKRVRVELGNEKADLIHGKNWNDYFVEYEEAIEPFDGFVYAQLGFVHYGEIDWETGDMECGFIPDKRERPDHLFADAEDLIGTEYSNNNVTAEFRGMHLQREKIELLLPSHRLEVGEIKSDSVSREMRRVGRPPKWDWEGAIAAISVGLAHSPSLLGTDGKQARIEELLADWFMDRTGDSPSTSQIRIRARKLLETIEKAEKAGKAI